MAQYQYINTSGQMQTIEADDPQTALASAVDIAPNSGVQFVTSPTGTPVQGPGASTVTPPTPNQPTPAVKNTPISQAAPASTPPNVTTANGTPLGPGGVPVTQQSAAQIALSGGVASGSTPTIPNTTATSTTSATGMDDESFLGVLGQINSQAQQNNQLVDQKNAVLQALVGNQLTAAQTANLQQTAPDVLAVIQGGNRDAMMLQASVLNDAINGKNSSTAASIQYLTQGYQAAQAQQEQTSQAAFANLITLADTFVDPKTGTVDFSRLGNAISTMYPGVDLSGVMSQLQGMMPISEYNKGFYQGSNSWDQPTTQGGSSLTDALVAQESGGSYSAVNKSSGALGKYQIMPEHIADLTNPATGQKLDPNNPADVQTFLNSPALQDQEYQNIIGQLSTQYNGDQDKIIAAYYGGAAGADVVGTPAGDKPQANGAPSINEYVQQVEARMNPSIANGATPAQIDASLTSGAPVTKGGNTYTQDQLYNAAMFSLLGVPATSNPIIGGMGSSGVRSLVSGKATDIMSAYGLSPADVASAAAEYKGLSSAESKLISTATFTKTYAATANANLNLALQADQQVGAGGAKIVNNYEQWLSGNYTPNGPLAQLETYVYTAAREYAKVTSGSVGSVASPTDAANSKVDALLSAAQSPQVFAQTVTAMQADMNNVTSEQGASINGFAPDVANLLGLASGGTDASPTIGVGDTSSTAQPGTSGGTDYTAQLDALLGN